MVQDKYINMCPYARSTEQVMAFAVYHSTQTLSWAQTEIEQGIRWTERHRVLEEARYYYILPHDNIHRKVNSNIHKINPNERVELVYNMQKLCKEDLHINKKQLSFACHILYCAFYGDMSTDVLDAVKTGLYTRNTHTITGVI